MFTLSCQNSLVAIYRFLLNQENDVGESWVVDYGAHVSYKAIHCLVIDFIFFEFANIKDTYIVKPFAAIKASKNEELFRANNTGCMSLSTSWSFFEFQRMTPPHRFCI